MKSAIAKVTADGVEMLQAGNGRCDTVGEV